MTWQKEYVEQLVFSLPLREAVKDRLREELWGHLVEIYDQELARRDSVDSARHAACRRLGSREEFATTFVQSLSGVERIEGKVLRWIAPIGVNDIWTYAARNTVRAIIPPILGLLVFSLATIKLLGMHPADAFLAWIGWTMTFVLAGVAAGALTCEIHGIRAAKNAEAATCRRFHGTTLRFVVCVAATSLATLLIWLVGLAATVIAVGVLGRGEAIQVIVVFGREVLLPIGLILSLLSPLSARAIEWQESRARNLPDWPYVAFDCDAT